MIKLKKIKTKIKEVQFTLEQRMPYIPEFNNVGTIIKMLIVSFLLCVIYSFSQVQHASEFYVKFLPTLQMFAPYVIFQVLLLIFFSKLISSQKPVIAILIIIILNFASVYIVHSAISKTFTNFFSDVDATLAQFFVSFGILFLFLIYFDWRAKNIDPAHTMAKLIFLQSKMRPHFLFNTLNSVISLVKKDPDTARKILLNLSELLRASIKEEEVSMYTLKEEVTLCKRYLDIEKIRLGTRLEVIWNIEEEMLKYQIPRLTIQPLVENSVLHGIQNLENGGRIDINIRGSSTEKLIIDIKNPIGKKQHYTDDKHNNISMENLRQRLRIYFNGDIEFKSYERNGFYYILLIIPQKENVELLK